MFTNIKIKDNDYKLRLSAKSCVELEKRLKMNPLNIFMKMGENELPMLEDLLITLHVALNDMQSNISMNDVYDLFDAYCEEGGSIQTLIELIAKLFMDSGLIPKQEDGKKSKNSK